MSMFIAILIGLVIVAAAVLTVVWKMSRRRGLPAAAAARLMSDMKRAQGITDVHRRVLDGEKVVDQALVMLGFKGTFADKLKAAGPRFSDVQALWTAHKLRNRIAHEVGVQVSGGDATRAMSAFERALRDLS